MKPVALGPRHVPVRLTTAATAFTLAVLCALSTACASAPSTLDPRGPRAAQIAEVWWISFGAAAAVFVLVMVLLLCALFLPRPRGMDDASILRTGWWVRDERRRFPDIRFVIAGGVVLPLVVLVPLSVYMLGTLAGMSAPASAAGVSVRVIGHQYWWEVRYPDRDIITANEIHVPVGQPVQLEVTSADVIHSFWVPQLSGKIDLVPGRTNTVWIQADQPGVYWGQCAEYCGLQHAKMAFVLVAEPPEQFAAWAERERQPAREPASPTAQRGAQVFSQAGCIQCHVIRYGTQAVGGDDGPDLTHFGSRLTVGAGILPNTRGNVAGWVGNPQAIKPGNLMPVLYLSPEDLLAVVSYLESLE